MTEKKTRAKAVTSLDDIKARCVEIGECWEWQGTVVGYDKNQPVHMVDRKMHKVHQTAFKLAGKNSPAGMYLVRECGNCLCVNPAHITPMTRSDQMKLAASLGRCSRPDQVAARTKGVRAASKLYSPELARTIRTMRSCGALLKDIAEQTGVSASVAAKVCSGEMWADSHQAASVFSWRAAA